MKSSINEDKICNKTSLFDFNIITKHKPSYKNYSKLSVLPQILAIQIQSKFAPNDKSHAETETETANCEQVSMANEVVSEDYPKDLADESAFLRDGASQELDVALQEPTALTNKQDDLSQEPDMLVSREADVLSLSQEPDMLVSREADVLSLSQEPDMLVSQEADVLSQEPDILVSQEDAPSLKARRVVFQEPNVVSHDRDISRTFNTFNVGNFVMNVNLIPEKRSKLPCKASKLSSLPQVKFVPEQKLNSPHYEASKLKSLPRLQTHQGKFLGGNLNSMEQIAETIDDENEYECAKIIPEGDKVPTILIDGAILRDDRNLGNSGRLIDVKERIKNVAAINKWINLLESTKEDENSSSDLNIPTFIDTTSPKSKEINSLGVTSIDTVKFFDKPETVDHTQSLHHVMAFKSQISWQADKERMINAIDSKIKSLESISLESITKDQAKSSKFKKKDQDIWSKQEHKHKREEKKAPRLDQADDELSDLLEIHGIYKYKKEKHSVDDYVGGIHYLTSTKHHLNQDKIDSKSVTHLAEDKIDSKNITHLAEDKVDSKSITHPDEGKVDFDLCNSAREETQKPKIGTKVNFNFNLTTEIPEMSEGWKPTTKMNLKFKKAENIELKKVSIGHVMPKEDLSDGKIVNIDLNDQPVQAVTTVSTREDDKKKVKKRIFPCHEKRIVENPFPNLVVSGVGLIKMDNIEDSLKEEMNDLIKIVMQSKGKTLCDLSYSRHLECSMIVVCPHFTLLIAIIQHI